MVWKVLLLVCLCLTATCFVCNIAWITANTPSVHSESTLASMNYSIDVDFEPNGDPKDPPDLWP